MEGFVALGGSPNSGGRGASDAGHASDFISVFIFASRVEVFSMKMAAGFFLIFSASDSFRSRASDGLREADSAAGLHLVEGALTPRVPRNPRPTKRARGRLAEPASPSEPRRARRPNSGFSRGRGGGLRFGRAASRHSLIEKRDSRFTARRFAPDARGGECPAPEPSSSPNRLRVASGTSMKRSGVGNRRAFP